MSKESDFFVEFDAYELKHPVTGKTYHTIPPRMAKVAITARRRFKADANGFDVEVEPEYEACFLLNGGAAKPPLFWMGAHNCI